MKPDEEGHLDPPGVTRRRFLGYLIAGPTLVVAAPILNASKAFAAEGPAPFPTFQLVDQYDLSDFIVDATRPFANLITVEVNSDGTVSFALH
ncbi:MAG: xanthine dehydrogenase family protein molybdopterin-binding subunit, partial [Actinomycetota bacterium]